MAHSLIQAHDREEEAFEHFAAAQPGNVVLLLDTYDTETAAHKLLTLAPACASAASKSRACASTAATWPNTPAGSEASSMPAAWRKSPSWPAAISTNTACVSYWRGGADRRFRYRHPAGCIR